MAKTKTPARPVTKRTQKRLSARDEIDLMLDRLGLEQVQYLGDGLDSPSSGVAQLFTIDVGDDGEVVLDVDVTCNTRIPLAALLRCQRREHEKDAFVERLRAEATPRG